MNPLLEARMKLKGVLLGVLMLSTVVLAQDSRLSFSLRGGYYIPSSSTFNKEYVPAVNNNLSDFASYLKDLGLSGGHRDMGKMNGTVVLGGEFELKAGPQFFIVLGAEYLFKGFENNLEMTGNVEQVAVEVIHQGKVRMSSLPILATIRINLPVSAVRVYMGGGAGYYFSQVSLLEKWVWLENQVEVSSGERKIVATAQDVIPHANLGADLRLSGRFCLTGDVRIPFGTIKSFKIKSDTLDQSTVGQNLTFLNLEGQKTEFKWELTGPSLTVSLKYKF
jgi:hypothetical protein